MKRLTATAFISTLLLGMSFQTQSAAAEPPVSVNDLPAKPALTAALEREPRVALLIGNSYSFYNCGVHTYLRGLMRASSPKIGMKTRLLTVSSGSLSFHDVAFYLSPHELDPYAELDNGRLIHPMFDVVLLQEHSAGALSKKRIGAFMKYTKAHADTIRAAGSTPLLIMTWAKETSPEDISAIAENTIRAANAAGMRVVPVGLAFARARAKAPSIRMTQADNSHPTAAGSYLYAAVLYETLFGRPVEGLDYAGECEKPLSPETVRIMQQIAHETVADFRGQH